MPTPFCRVSAAFALCSLLQAAGADPPDPAAPIDFSVLTPAMEGRFMVASNIDLTAMLPPYFPFGDMSRGKRSDELRAFVAREHYDPMRTIADRLIDTLGESSYRAVYEPIKRKPAGSLQPLSWGDLPEKPQGELMLDLTIRWICLCADVAFTKYYPAISINWRLLDPAQVVVAPTRTLTYFHFPDWYSKDRPRSSQAPGGTTEFKYPAEKVSEVCGFDHVKDAEKDPQVLLGCFGEAFDAALRHLVIDLKKLHPPRAAVTASADNPS